MNNISEKIEKMMEALVHENYYDLCDALELGEFNKSIIEHDLIEAAASFSAALIVYSTMFGVCDRKENVSRFNKALLKRIKSIDINFGLSEN